MIDPGNRSEGTSHRTKRFAAMRRVLGGVVLLALLAGGGAVSPPVGSEVLLTDADGGRFVGYGTVTNSGLQIELSEDIRDLRVVVVTPDGTSQPYGGHWNGETLTLTDTSGSEVDLADELAEDGRLLSLAWPDGRSQVVMPGAASEEAGDVPAQDDSPGAGEDPADVADDQAGVGDDEPGRSGDAPGRSDDEGDRDTPADPDQADRDERDDDGQDDGQDGGQDDGRPDLPDPDLPDAAPDVPARGGPDRDEGQDGQDDADDVDDADEGDTQDEDDDADVEADVDADAEDGVDVEVGVGDEDGAADDGAEQDDADESDEDDEEEDEDGSSGAVDLNLP